MPAPTSASEALKQCELMWRWLAANPEKDKRTAVAETLDYRPTSNCPACHWAAYGDANKYLIGIDRCNRCPVDTWRAQYAGCDRPGSPFKRWQIFHKLGKRKQTSVAAMEIVELARSSEAYVVKPVYSLEPCAQCGAPAGGVSWGGVMEYSTKSNEQTCTLDCSVCDMQVSITVNPEALVSKQSKHVEQTLKFAWNALYWFKMS